MTPRKKDASAAPLVAVQNGFSLISNEKLLSLYTAMLKCRMLAKRSHTLIEQHEFSGRNFASIGQEAAATGVVIDLLPEDTVVSPPGYLIPSFIHGSTIEALFADLLRPVAPVSSITAQLKRATDAGVANKANKNDKVSVAFGPGESSSLGPWQAALAFAGIHSLPMIFVSWNALPSPPPPFDSRSRTKGISLEIKAPCFPAIAVDGNDAVAVYRVAHESIAHARSGQGPTLIDCQIDPSNPGNPILNMEKYLLRKGLFTETFKAEVTVGFSKEMDAVLDSAESSVSRKPSTPRAG